MNKPICPKCKKEMRLYATGKELQTYICKYCGEIKHERKK